MKTVPTGLRFVPPPGPAMPVMAIAKSAPNFFRAPPVQDSSKASLRSNSKTTPDSMLPRLGLVDSGIKFPYDVTLHLVIYTKVNLPGNVIALRAIIKLNP